jgi:hypothetical protein
MMTKGCPLNKAKALPVNEVVIKVSEIPIKPKEFQN